MSLSYISSHIILSCPILSSHIRSSLLPSHLIEYTTLILSHVVYSTAQAQTTGHPLVGARTTHAHVRLHVSYVNSAAWYGMAWCVIAWHDMAWYWTYA